MAAAGDLFHSIWRNNSRIGGICGWRDSTSNLEKSLKRLILVCLPVVLASVVLVVPLFFAVFAGGRQSRAKTLSAAGFTLNSPAFQNGARIPNKYTCEGEN